MALALIAELLPCPSRSITVAYEYDYRQEWMEKLWRIIVRSGPKVVSAHECNTNIPADFDLVWSLQFHKTGIGFAALRVVNRPILPASVTFLRKARYEDKPDDRIAAFLWIRVINIGLFFSLSRLRLAQSNDPGAKFAFTLEHLKGGVLALPESNRGCRIGCLNCRPSKPASDQNQEQIRKSEAVHKFVLDTQLGRAVPGYSDGSDQCWFHLEHSANLPARKDWLADVTNLVRIDEFLPYIARRVTIAFGYNRLSQRKEPGFSATRPPENNIR